MGPNPTASAQLYMDVIFLDIDGVLNCKNTIEKWEGCYGIDPILLERLNSILRHIDVKIVLSSCWRHSDTSIEFLKNIKKIPIFDITPDSKDGIRGKEIQQWLKKHPEVKTYAILDDDSDMLPGQTLFKTTFEEGLTNEIVHDIIDFFRFHSDPKICLNCGRHMKRVKDPITRKSSIYLWKCKCMPAGCYMSAGKQ